MLPAQEAVATAKLLVAGAATLWLAVRAFAPRRLASPALSRAWDVGLIALGVLGAVAWFNFFQFNYPTYGHPTETYHYYMGSKYFAELGYTRLYRCTALADAEDVNERWARGRLVRNLETNSFERGERALASPELCKAEFSDERWEAFKWDLAEFRRRVPKRSWDRIQIDHGYNGTPVWGLLGRALADTGPATPRQVLALQMADLPLLLLGWGALAWGFGWRVLCVALVYWGTNAAAGYDWVGGSYLRQAELAAVLVALAVLKRGWARLCGFLLGFAVLVRVYPAFLFLGPALQALGALLRERRLGVALEPLRLAVGGVLAAALLLPLTAATPGGLAAWRGFADNSRILLETPMLNRVGLPTFIAYEHTSRASALVDESLSDPYVPWKEAQARLRESRRGWLPPLAAGFLVLVGLAVQRQPAWVAVVLSTGLVLVLSDLTNYYSAVLVLYALLWERSPPVGLALIGLSVATLLIARTLPKIVQMDERFAWISLACLGYVTFATIWVLARRQTDAGPQGVPS